MPRLPRKPMRRIPLPAPSAGAAVAVVIGLAIGIVIGHNASGGAPQGGSGVSDPGAGPLTTAPGDNVGGDLPPMEVEPGTTTAFGSSSVRVPRVNPVVTPSAPVLTWQSASTVTRRETSVITVPSLADPPVASSAPAEPSSTGPATTVPATTTPATPTSNPVPGAAKR